MLKKTDRKSVLIRLDAETIRRLDLFRLTTVKVTRSKLIESILKDFFDQAESIHEKPNRQTKNSRGA